MCRRALAVPLMLIALLPLLSVTANVPNPPRCTDSRGWICAARRLGSAHALIQNKQNTSAVFIRPPFDVTFNYLNKVHPITYKLQASGRLRWTAKLSTLRELSAFHIHMLDGSGKEQAFELAISRNPDDQNRPESEVSFYIPLELQFGMNYTVTIFMEPSKGRVRRLISLPSLVTDDVDCSQEVKKGETERTRQAARFSSTFKELLVHPDHSVMDISFFAAPTAYCIPAYDVKLFLEGVLVVDSHTIKTSDLVYEDGHWVGKVTLSKFVKTHNYTLEIIPHHQLTTNTTCVCLIHGNCGCVNIKSQMFAFPDLRTYGTDAKTNGTDQIVRIYVLDGFSGSSVDANILLIVSLVLLLVTLCLFILCILLALRRRRQMLGHIRLVRQHADEKSHRPLMSDCLSSSTSSVLLLAVDSPNAETIKSVAEFLANSGVRVRYHRWEKKAIEENMNHWVQNVLSTADKILLFHTRKAAKLISGELPSDTHRDVFDDVFRQIYSGLSYTDTRLMHIRPEQESILLPLHGEHIYVLPRDMKQLCNALHISDGKTYKYNEISGEVNNASDNEVTSEPDKSLEAQPVAHDSGMCVEQTTVDGDFNMATLERDSGVHSQCVEQDEHALYDTRKLSIEVNSSTSDSGIIV